MSYLSTTPFQRARAFILLLLCGLASASLLAGDFSGKEFVDLSGQWRFQEGDDPGLMAPDLDDTKWDIVAVPESLRGQGKMKGYEQVAWYRLHFDWPLPQENLSLTLGQIHDADEVWLNGEWVGGEGRITPSEKLFYITAYHKMRVYPLTSAVLRKEDNVLAVRVRSAVMPGGIAAGPVGIGKTQPLLNLAAEVNRRVVTVDVIIIAIYTGTLVVLLMLIALTLRRNNELYWLAVLVSVALMICILDSTWAYMLGIKSLVTAALVMIGFLLMPWIVLRYYRTQGLALKNRWIAVMEWTILISTLGQIMPIDILIRAGFTIFWVLSSLLILIPVGISTFRAVLRRKVGAIAHFIALIALYTLCLLSIFYGGQRWLNWRDAELGMVLFVVILMIGYFQRVRALQVEHQALSARVLSASDNERQALSRELHDGVGQHLAALKLRLGLAKTNQDLSQIEKAQSVIEEAVSDMRHLVKSLGPVALENCTLAQAIQNEVISINEYAEIDLHINIVEIEFSPMIAHHLYRAFQECLNNAIRHSEASNIKIHLQHHSQNFELTIDDDGNGFDPELTEPTDSGVGLVSLKERLDIIGGQIEIHSRKGKGTRIQMSGPIS